MPAELSAYWATAEAWLSNSALAPYYPLAALIISIWSIGAARAAKRSASAAETQAFAAVKQVEHAEQQAASATLQARAAEQQVQIMRSTMTVDHIGSALKTRRGVVRARAAVRALADAETRFRQRPEGRKALEAVRDCTADLEDGPPVFPANVRHILFGYIQDLNAIDDGVVEMTQKSLPSQELDMAAGIVIAAMDVAITEKVAALQS